MDLTVAQWKPIYYVNWMCKRFTRRLLVPIYRSTTETSTKNKLQKKFMIFCINDTSASINYVMAYALVFFFENIDW